MNYGDDDGGCMSRYNATEKLFNWISEQRRLTLALIPHAISIDEVHRSLIPLPICRSTKINKHFAIFGRLSMLWKHFGAVSLRCHSIGKHICELMITLLLMLLMLLLLFVVVTVDDVDCVNISVKMCSSPSSSCLKCDQCEHWKLFAAKLFALVRPPAVLSRIKIHRSSHNCSAIIMIIRVANVQSSLERSLSASSRCKTSLNIMKIHTLPSQIEICKFLSCIERTLDSF